MVELSKIIDVGQYPINVPDTIEYADMLRNLRSTYLRDGIVILPGFLTKETIDVTVQEISKAKGQEWMTDSTHNVFLDKGDPAFPEQHIRNRLLPTTVASLAYDRLSVSGYLLSLYHSDHFTKFLSQVLGLESLYRLEDPLGAASINIFPPGTAHNWHFDESVFSVTIMIQKPQSGGLFRNTKPIRVKGEEDDELYNVLENIVNGSKDIAETLLFEPGTLSIFCGSRCLHEVTKVHGLKDRLVAVFCFATSPGVRNSKQVQKLFWGRAVD